MTQILIIARENSVGSAYVQMLEKLGAHGILASETATILQTMRTVSIHGILIHMPTFLRLHGEGKHIINDMLACFPLLRCRIDKESGVLTVFDQEQDAPEQVFARFAQQCKNTPPRTIRRAERFFATCSILLSQDTSFAPQQTERTITINVSEYGAFCFSTHPWKPGNSAWVQFLDLTDKTPIMGTVVHAQRWGKGCHLPGCGMDFTTITAEQQKELKTLLAGSCGHLNKSFFVA